MKKIVVALMIACFMIVGIANADEKQSPIPDTIVSPELAGPHYIWSAEPPADESANETNIQDRVEEESITPGTEDRIKEVVDQQNH